MMGPQSIWPPLRIAVFHALRIANLASTIGTWVQEVGAGWLMTELRESPVLVALVQSAASLAMMLLVLPAGVLADYGRSTQDSGRGASSHGGGGADIGGVNLVGRRHGLVAVGDDGDARGGLGRV